jgi:hypothetical protein
MPGYGGTDKPTDPAEYTFKKLADDLAAILDVVGAEKAVRCTLELELNLGADLDLAVGSDRTRLGIADRGSICAVASG